MSEILVDASTLEEWVCQQDQKEIVGWIKQNEQEKIQKYLSYAWSHPSERIKQYITNLLIANSEHPISFLCMEGDPSNGKLLRLFLNFMESIDQDYFRSRPPDYFSRQQSFLMLAVIHEKLTLEELRMILTHPKAISPFSPNPEGAPFEYWQNECAIEISIRKNNLDYFKEMIRHGKDVQMDKALSLACRLSLKVLQYLIEEEGLSVNETVCGKTPLQHTLNFHGEKKPAADYLISRGADVTQKDEKGNLAYFYACIFGYNNIDQLIAPNIDLRARTNGLILDQYDFPDGSSPFGVAAQFNDHKSLKHLLEVKAALPQDPELDRVIVEEVILNGDYIAIWTMWPYIQTRDVINFLTTERIYEFKDGKKELKPIEKLFRDFLSIDTELNGQDMQSPYNLIQKEANVRAMWKHALQKFSREEIDTLLNTQISEGGKLRYFVESLRLLPDEYRFSNNLWKSEVTYDLGKLSNLPHEITQLIFCHLSVFDACGSASVSKSWFKEITAKQIWLSHPRADPNCSNPFRSIQKSQANDRITQRKSDECFRQIVRVDDGEGLLVLESEFLTGLKLNGEPIMCSWPHYHGSIYRCMVRSRSLSQENIEAALHHIEIMLNTGRIDFSILVDTLMPFMKCLPSGFYDVLVQMGGSNELFEYKSDSDLSTVHTGCPVWHLIYFTQPSDLLSEERVKFYEDQIRRGSRPAALAITVYEEHFIIDGHHKMLAYKNLGLLKELVIIGITYNEAKIAYPKISTEEEMKYISHSRAVQERYRESKKTMRPDEDNQGGVGSLDLQLMVPSDLNL